MLTRKMIIVPVLLAASVSFASLDEDKSNIISLIEQGKYDQAKTETQKLISSSPKTSALSEVVSSIAMQFELLDKYDDAKGLYQQMLQTNPDSTWTSKAKLGIARTEVLLLIMAKDGRVKAAYDKLVADFAGHPDLAETRYYVARRYEWADKYEDAKAVYYQQITQGHNDSPYTPMAKLGIARTNVLSLIMSQNQIQAKKDFDKLVTDFSGNPDLPDTIYYVARRYEWADNYEEAKNVYQQLLQSVSPADPNWADRSKLGFERANILSLILSQNYDQAEVAYDKLLTEGLSNHSDFPATLHWIARRYEWGKKFDEAKNIYQKIITDYPNCSYVSKARLGLSRAEVAARIDSQDYNGADAAFDKLVTDFSNHPDLVTAILASGEQCYKEGLSKESAGLEVQAMDRFEKAVQMWEKLITQFPDSSWVPEACCWAGDCYFEKLNRYEDSIHCFQKVTDNYPKYKYAWHAQFMVGRSYEVLKNKGVVDKSAADAKIKDAYERVMENYPDCSAAGYASNWLSNQARVEKEN
jgi:tetratricopeptide (TPR) repeat protein